MQFKIVKYFICTMDRKQCSSAIMTSNYQYICRFTVMSDWKFSVLGWGAFSLSQILLWLSLHVMVELHFKQASCQFLLVPVNSLCCSLVNNSVYFPPKVQAKYSISFMCIYKHIRLFGRASSSSMWIEKLKNYWGLSSLHLKDFFRLT